MTKLEHENEEAQWLSAVRWMWLSLFLMMLAVVLQIVWIIMFVIDNPNHKVWLIAYVGAFILSVYSRWMAQLSLPSNHVLYRGSVCGVCKRPGHTEANCPSRG